MTQEERWLARYNEVKTFIEANKRNPSKYSPEEKSLVNWVKQQRKLVNVGLLKTERVEAFKRLIELWNKNKRVNQYQ